MRRALIVVACLVLIAAPLASAAEAPKGTIVHSVYFWLKKEATDADAKALIADCKALAALDCVVRADVGVPLGKSRGAVDGSYQVAVVVYFADQAAYDTYLPHPKHQALVKKHKPLWEKVVVYDIVKK